MIGRSKEIETLRQAYSSDQSEFVALYGRRRVGKTFAFVMAVIAALGAGGGAVFGVVRRQAACGA